MQDSKGNFLNTNYEENEELSKIKTKNVYQEVEASVVKGRGGKIKDNIRYRSITLLFEKIELNRWKAYIKELLKTNVHNYEVLDRLLFLIY